MALASRTSKLYRTSFITCRNYCEKSVYQRNEDGPKTRMVHGQPYPELRKPWIQRDGEWSSKLSIFIEKNPNPDILYAMSQIPNLTFKKIKEWWASMNELQEIENQKFLQERVATLGSNLAAVHFFTYRFCAVRLKDSREWITGDITNLKLPSTFTDGYFVEAVDCTNFHRGGIRYEGLENLRNLNFLKWLSLKNNKYVDVWCIDRVAGLNGKTLEYLDISGCNISEGSILALSRMEALKHLVITDPGDNVALQAGFSMLEADNPKLVIRAIPPESKENVINSVNPSQNVAKFNRQ